MSTLQGWLHPQDSRIRRLVESANDRIPDDQDRDPQLAVLVDEGVPEVGLRNRRPALIPSDDFAADLDVEDGKAPGDLQRFCGSDRVMVNVMIGEGEAVLREKLPRAVARRSPCPIVENDPSHGPSGERDGRRVASPTYASPPNSANCSSTLFLRCSQVHCALFTRIAFGTVSPKFCAREKV